jgi:glycosyltransferase involved in cell wall biosynthesis
MWDEARTYDEAVWAAVPRAVRIVAYSRAVANLTTAMGFPTLTLQYFLDPGLVQPASWSDGPVLYYWNRTGLFDPGFLAKLCRSLGATRLLFRGQLDPRISSNASYQLPSRLGSAAVTEVAATLGRDEYLRVISSANVFLAPRASEGVGLMLVEALARGQAAFACDAPAMNEYIAHGEDGVLLRLAPPSNVAGRSPKRVRWFGARKPVERPNADLAPAADQEWFAISALDLPAMGRKARERHRTGFQAWKARISELARFVLEW